MVESQHGTTHMRDAFEVVSAAVIRRLSAIDITSAHHTITQLPMTHDQTQAVNTFVTGPDASIAMPWSTNWLDPSRPSSPQRPLAGASTSLDDFFFDPFGTLPSFDDLMFDLGSGSGVGGMAAGAEASADGSGQLAATNVYEPL